MNCETCQELIHDLVDGSISQRDEFTLNTHLKECLDCVSVRRTWRRSSPSAALSEASTKRRQTNTRCGFAFEMSSKRSCREPRLHNRNRNDHF